MINSLLFGIIPDVIFFTLFITYVKNLKYSRIKLFFTILIIYLLCVTIQRFELLYYVILIILMCIAVKVFYNKETEMIDITIITFELIYVMTCSFISFKIFKNDMSYYYYALWLDKLLVLIPLVFREKWNIVYRKYVELWDRKFLEKRIVKSITVRNFAAIFLCIALIVIHRHILLII